jgi:hypothetical protein
MEQMEPVVTDPAPLPMAYVVDRNTDLRSSAQRACDKLPSCEPKWCDMFSCGDIGCELPCQLLEVFSVLDVGCL